MKLRKFHAHHEEELLAERKGGDETTKERNYLE